MKKQLPFIIIAVLIVIVAGAVYLSKTGQQEPGPVPPQTAQREATQAAPDADTPQKTSSVTLEKTSEPAPTDAASPPAESIDGPVKAAAKQPTATDKKTAEPAAPVTAADENRKYEFKLASLAPKHVGWAKLIREIIDPAFSNATNGNVKLKWYWGGVMGNDQDYITKMKIGQLDGAAFTGQGVVLVCPEMAVLELPFMFNNYDEVDYIRQKMYPTFDRYAEKRGYKLVVWGDQDFDQIYSTEKPLDSLNSFKGEKFVTWYGHLEEKLLKTLDTTPTPINVTEIAASIQQGVADDLIAPAVWVMGCQLYKRFDYVNPVKIRYSPAAVFVTKKTFYSVPAAYQKGILDMRDKEVVTFCKKTREYTDKTYDAMIKNHIKQTGMNPEELKALKEKSKTIWKDMIGDYFPEELLTELIGHLEDYRAKKVP